MKPLIIALASTAVLALAVPASSLADPGGPNLQQPITLSCSDGTSPVVNPGTNTNQGRVAWVTTSNGVYVTAYLAFSDGTTTEVLFDSKQGLQAHQTLVSCSGDAGGGSTVLATGFFTPHS
jgi:hypothetical protein